MKSVLTIHDRTLLLLKHGVDHPEKWAIVHDYDETAAREALEGDAFSVRAEYDRLRTHHLVETNFLFDMLRAMCAHVDLLDEQMASTIVDPSLDED